MKKIMYALTSKNFWFCMGVVFVLSMVWFYGGELSIGELRPLETKNSRMIFIFLTLLFVTVRFLWKRFKQKKINDQFVADMTKSQPAMLKNEKANSAIRQQFLELDKTLKNAKFFKSNRFNFNIFSSGKYLYQLPFYVVLGGPNSGKTTMIKNSKLNFPQERHFGTSIKGLQSTQDCSLFLSDDAIWVDTAGRLSLQNSNITDISDWLELIKELRRLRNKQPINGIVVTVGVDELLDANADLHELGVHLRNRINEMSREFGIDFPVYLVITKLDMLDGFDAFATNIPEEYQSEPMGFQITKEHTNADYNLFIGQIVKKLAIIRNSLDRNYVHLLDDEKQKYGLFTFTEDFSILSNRLVALFDGLYKSSRIEGGLSWRGVYFTSSVQDGEALSPYLDSFVEDFELTKKAINNNTFKKETKSLFVNALLSKIIIDDSGLAEMNTSWSYNLRSYKWLPYIISFGVSFSIFLLLINSYSNNLKYVDEIKKNSEDIKKELEGKNKINNLLHAILLAEKIKNVIVVDGVDLADFENPSYNYTIGLYQGKSLKEVSDSKYQRALKNTIMPMIHQRIDQALREGLDADSLYMYDTLKAYLMLYPTNDDTKEHYDKDFLKEWLKLDLKSTYEILNNKNNKNIIDGALDYLLDPEIIVGTLPYDAKLVKAVREKITSRSLSNMIVDSVIKKIDNLPDEKKSEIKNISYRNMGKEGTYNVFKTKDETPLSTPINFIYTRDVYDNHIKSLIKSESRLVAEQKDWLLAEYSTEKKDEDQIFKEVKNLYFTNYITEWESYLAKLELKEPQYLSQAQSFLKVLSNEYNSPLKNMIIAINYNTSIDKTLISGFAAGADRKIEELGISGKIENFSNKVNDVFISDNEIDMSDESQSVLLEATDQPVEELLTRYHNQSTIKNKQINPKIQELNERVLATDISLVSKKYIEYSEVLKNNEEELDSIISSIRDLGEYVDSLNYAIEKGVDLPNTDEVMNFRSNARRLPKHFQDVFNDFTDYLLEEWLSEKVKREKLAVIRADLEKESRKSQEQELKDEIKKEKLLQKKEQETKEQKAKEEQETKEQKTKELLKVDNLNKASSSIKNRLESTSILCKNQTKDNYPFVQAKTDITLFSFVQIFGKNGYPNKNKLSAQTSTIFGVETLTELVKNNDHFSEYETLKDLISVNKTYFTKGTESPGLDVNIEIVSLDPQVDKLLIRYGGNEFEYSHGPIIPFNTNWPAEENKLDIKLYTNDKVVANLSVSGDWALFRLIDMGVSKKHNKNNSVVQFTVDGYNFSLSFKSESPGNPFNLDNLRGLSCV